MPNATIHTAAWLIHPDMPPIAGGAILVRDGMIEAAGTLAELKSVHTAPAIEHPDCAIIPGFINAHTHLELTHFPAWRERNGMGYSPRRFVDWIIQLIKVTRGLSDDDFRSSISSGIRMSLDAGCTTIGDILTRYNLLPGYRTSPATFRVFFEVLGHEPARFTTRLNDALNRCGTLTGGHYPGLSPHAPYTISGENMRLAAATARQHSLPLSVHLSESPAEVDFVFDTTGQIADTFYPFVGWEQFLTAPRRTTPTELFDAAGLLTPSTLAVHCVHVTLAEARLLKERGASVCLCPRSNERLDVGAAPVGLFRKLGIPLALGTDSLASNDSLSLWDEMRFALDRFSAELSPDDVFRMATSGGAAALGLARSVGSLEAGKRADFQVVATPSAPPQSLTERMIHQGKLHEVYIAGSPVVHAARE